MEAMRFQVFYARTALAIQLASLRSRMADEAGNQVSERHISAAHASRQPDLFSGNIYENDTSAQLGRPMEQLELESTHGASNNAAEDESRYPNTTTIVLVCIACAVAIVPVSLNTQILATAVPHITDEFGTIADIGWYSSAYRLSVCAFQFMYGRMFRLWSLKRTFMATVVIFEIGTLACALSPSSAALVAARAVQGLGAAGIVSGAFCYASVSVPLRRRPVFLAGVALAEELLGAIAPFVGGLITQGASWRWCFYMNLPLGALSLVMIWLFSPDLQTGQDENLSFVEKIAKLDLVGTAIFIPGIVALLLALQFGGSTFGWQDPRIIVCSVLSAALITAFAGWQMYKQDEATLPPRIIRKRSILMGMLFSGCNNGLFTVVEYYLPIYLQTVRQLSPQSSGLLVLPLIISLTLSLFCGGAFTTWIGYWVPTMYFTAILTPIACGLLSTFSVSGPLVRICLYQALLGIGVGLGFQGPQFAAQTLLSRSDTPLGIACIQFAQNFGPAIMVPAAQTLFTAQLSRNLMIEAPGVNSTSIEMMGLSDLQDKVQASQLSGTLLGFDQALMQTMYLPTAAACFLIFSAISMEWKSLKRE